MGGNKKLFISITAIILFLFGAVPSEPLTLSIDNGGYNFGTGDILNLSAGLSHSGSTVPADIYIAVLFPNGTPVFLQLDPAGHITGSAATADPATWKKFLSNVNITNGLNTGLVTLLNYTFTGSEPTGTFQAIFAATEPGTLNVLAYISKSFFVDHITISNIEGTYSGTWTNQTFGVSGPVTLQVTDTSAGVLTVTVTLGGNVFGSAAPPPFSVAANLDSQGNLTISGGSSSFGTVQGSISANGNIQGTVTSIPSSSVSSMSLSGTYSNGTINLNYTVYFTSGSSATGIATATKQ